MYYARGGGCVGPLGLAGLGSATNYYSNSWRKDDRERALSLSLPDTGLWRDLEMGGYVEVCHVVVV